MLGCYSKMELVTKIKVTSCYEFRQLSNTNIKYKLECYQLLTKRIDEKLRLE